MTCEKRRDLLLLHAAGALDDPERREVLVHLDTGCPVCAGAMAEAQATLAHLPLGLDPVEPPARLRQRLMARVADESARTAASGSGGVAPLRRPTTGNWWRPALAAVAASLVVLVAGGFVFQQRQSRLADRISDLDEVVAGQRQEIQHLRDSLDGAMNVVARYARPDVRVFELGGTEHATTAAGRVFWDRATGTWDFHVAGLAPSSTDRTYQLWFITADQRKVSAGTFDVGADGVARMLEISIPDDVGVISVAAVTDEPRGGSLQPTGQIRLAGEVPAST